MFGVLRYYLLALWRDNLCLEGPEVGSSGPVTLNLVRYTLAIAHVCGFLSLICSAYCCGREDPVVVSLFHGLKAMYGLMLKMMIVISSCPA